MRERDDDRWMKTALRIARRGAGRTSPNPMVGAVVVVDGREVGAGWHRAPGESHAEVVALQKAGEQARGATIYVNLEPCIHHGRTPPCVGAVIAAGVKRVVVATADPDPRVSGRGIEGLRAAGIEVIMGVMEARARSLNEAYILHRRLGRPFVTYKAAVSLDGRIAPANRRSKWITSDESRRDAQLLRAKSDAICVGIKTVLADDPSLRPRGVRSPGTPLRVVVDSDARTPLSAKVLSHDAPTLVAATETAPADRLNLLQEAGAEVAILPSEDRGVSVKALLADLGERGILSLLLEGGGTLAGSFARVGGIDRFVFYFAPKLLGSKKTVGALQSWGAATMAEAEPLEIESIKRVGSDVRITARPSRNDLRMQRTPGASLAGAADAQGL